jgi:hypothetical protein
MLIKKTALLLLSAFTVSTHASTNFNWRTALNITGGSLGFGVVNVCYNNLNYTQFSTMFHDARTILHTHRNDRQTCIAHLNIEIMREHEKLFCLNIASDMYRYYPLLYYKHRLDAALFHLCLGKALTLGLNRSQELSDLIYDLRSIRYLIESESAFVLEQYLYHDTVQRTQREKACTSC